MKKLPGSKHVTYVHNQKQGVINLYLDQPPIQAYVSDGLFYILIDSRKLAADFMEKDEGMTRNLQYAHEICDDGFRELMEGWVAGALDCSGDTRASEQGPKDWSPGGERFRKRGKVTGHGNTYNFSDSEWQGGVFEYVTFDLPGDRQGFAVFWHLGGDPRGNYDPPEVWVGDVSGFLDMQWMDIRDMETLHSLNADFDSGIVWAVETLGLLGPNKGVLENLEDPLREMITEAPKLISEKTRDDILAHPKNYAKWVVDAVRSIR